jgi:valyl-tRNA synthetase
VDFRTAVAQAELEDREMPARTIGCDSPRRDGGAGQSKSKRRGRADSRVRRAGRPSGRSSVTSRCSARSADAALGVPVPVRPHPLADPEKGSGIAMICTFGDSPTYLVA